MSHLQFVLGHRSSRGILLFNPVLTTIPTTHLRTCSSLHHTSDNLIRNLRSSQRRRLTLVIIARRNLDNIRPNNIQLLQAAQDADDLAGGPAAGLGGPSARRSGGVQDINVDGKINGLVRVNADTLDDLVDDAKRPA